VYGHPLPAGEDVGVARSTGDALGAAEAAGDETTEGVIAKAVGGAGEGDGVAAQAATSRIDRASDAVDRTIQGCLRPQ
jgi:hypothetical protein